MSSQVTITQLPAAGPITGTESVPVVQNGVTVQTTAAALAGSPIQTQTFLTLNQEPTLANSRYLGATNGLVLTASVAQGVLNITTTGALSSLVSSGTGLQVKTDATTLTGRTIAAGSSGISITNGSGVSGNPTISLTSPLVSIVDNGFVSIANGGTGQTTATAAFAALAPSQSGNSGKYLTTDGSSISWGSLPASGTVTSVSVASANGFGGTVANATTTPVITITSSVIGLLKGAGTAVSAATSGVDYAPATSGSSILYGNGSGGFSNVTIGSGLTFSAGTLSAPAGAGTVTSVSVVSANGLAGTVANATTTPAITLSTTVTGLLKGDGTTISAATSGTDYAPATSGTSILYGNGSGGFSSVTIGSGLTFSTGTLSSTATGTVTSVTGTSPVASSGGTTPAISLSSGYGDTQNPYSSKTANYVLAAPNGSAGVPTFRAIVAADIPTLNQNTTGTASNVTGTVAVANGGTGLTSTPANGALDIGNGTGFTRTTLTAGTGISVTNASGGITITNTSPSSGGTVTSVSGTSPVSVATGTTTPVVSLASGYGDTQNPYASKTANYFLSAPNGTAGVPTFRAIVAADIPTLNQNTTGTAAGLSSTLVVGSGGTGATTLTGYLVGNGTSAFTAVATIPNAGLTNSAITIGSTSVSLGGTITTLTGTSINGSTNTLTNIGNSSLSNSQVTIGSTAVSLGATASSLAGLASVAVTADPTTALQLTTKQYVDGLAANGLTYHQPVQAATTATLASITGGTVTYNNGTAGVGATLTLSVALTTLDGYTLLNTNRILVKNEATQANNGIYTWATGGTVLTRATDADTYGPGTNQLSLNDYFFVQNGTVNKGISYVLTTTGTITFGTTAITFAEFSSSQVYTGTAPINVTGTVISIGTVPVGSGGTNITSYTIGDMLYASASTTLSRLSLGTSGYVLTAGASAPSYVAQSTLSVGAATNISGGAAGSVPYNTGSGTTAFLALGTTNYVLTAGASAPQYVAQSTLSVGSATTATNATNVALTAGSGATNYIHFSSSATGNQATNTSSSLTFNATNGTITSGISGGTF